MERTLFSYLTVCIGALIGFLYGEFTGMLKALIILCTFDYVTGVMVAVKRHRVSSKKGYQGIFKKVCIMILISIAHLVDVHVIKSGNVFMSMTTLYYISNESISVLENCDKLGLPIPEKLRKILEQVRNDSDKDSPSK